MCLVMTLPKLSYSQRLSSYTRRRLSCNGAAVVSLRRLWAGSKRSVRHGRGLSGPVHRSHRDAHRCIYPPSATAARHAARRNHAPLRFCRSVRQGGDGAVAELTILMMKLIAAAANEVALKRKLPGGVPLQLHAPAVVNTRSQASKRVKLITGALPLRLAAARQIIFIFHLMAQRNGTRQWQAIRRQTPLRNLPRGVVAPQVLAIFFTRRCRRRVGVYLLDSLVGAVPAIAALENQFAAHSARRVSKLLARPGATDRPSHRAYDLAHK